jgi:type II secretory pathway pseudopilin PulG
VTQKSTQQFGFTLLELIVGIGIFMILVSGLLGAYNVLAQTVKSAREKTTLASLSSQYLEIVRNLPYSDVGTVNGNPSGTLPDYSNAFTSVIGGQTYKIYYEVTYIDDPADGTILAGTDLAPNDYKQVKMFVLNVTKNTTTSFVTTVVPKGLEGLVNAGALYLAVFDANGQPINGATVSITNTAVTPNIILSRTSDATGHVLEVGLPASVNGYQITVTKTGYSTDATAASSVANPNPTKPHATIVDGQVTQVSFSIDLLSSLTIKTQNQVCAAVNGVNMNIRGAKLIGTTPNVLKFDQNFSSSGGQVALPTAEWDTYVPTLLTGQSVMVYGTSPIQQISVLPATSQTYTMIVGPATTNSLLVIVKDAATGTALEGATVVLHKTGAGATDYSGITGGSVWRQTDWSGGPGQTTAIDATRYFTDDGNIYTAGVPTGVRLLSLSGSYVASGTIESSTFDTGAVSNFTTLSWEPTSQNPATTVKFQIATNNDGTTWNYKGPDGTNATYYTTPGTTMSTVHDSDRYVRYKMFLTTSNPAVTPVVTSVSLNYVSGCPTPGQVMFPGLSAGSNYDLETSLSGYQTKVDSSLNINGNQAWEVLLTP